MKDFLQIVAEDLRRRFADDLSRVAVIFPGKRASLFLNEYLCPPTAEAAIWAPGYLSISQLFRSLSTKTVADPIDTVCRLYSHYTRLTKSRETPEFFYGWGERILADFDDVDKNMVAADDLFRDLREYEALTADDYLSDDQIRELRRYIRDFSQPTPLRESFLRVWNNLLPLYNALRDDLSADGLAYEGQLYREVVEQLVAGTITLPEKYTHYAFVGHNVLDGVTHRLFRLVHEQGKALFYWDHDTYYTGNAAQEAGHFLRQDLRDFPQSLPKAVAAHSFTNLQAQREQRHLGLVEASSDTAQAQCVNDWVSDAAHFRPDRAARTAVVLADETLLQPVLQALPALAHSDDDAATDQPERLKVNVTMGFPLSHTPAYADVVRLKDRVASLDELSQRLQTCALKAAETARGDEWLTNLYAESYYRTLTTINRFSRLEVAKRFPATSPALVMNLLTSVLRTTTIPFHGEPVEGLQVMGVLETRCLDFDHVLLLSAGEGILPRKATEASFIPHLLRRRYGLTTGLHRNALYAYYFYRLLQRARHVTICFNGSTMDTKRGEMSRFVRALLCESGIRIPRTSLTTTPTPLTQPVDEMEKPHDLPQCLTTLSPSAINAYLRCQLAFYYRYVAHIKPPTPPDALITPTDFGTVFHRAAELFYAKWAEEGHPITPEMLQASLKALQPHGIERLTEEAFATAAQAPDGTTSAIEAPPVVHVAMRHYLLQLLRYEAGLCQAPAPAAEFVIQGLEREANLDLEVPYGEGETAHIRIHGIIDRVDQIMMPGDITPRLRVIDYKTGGHMETHATADNLFDPYHDKYPHSHYTLQAFIYSLIMQEQQSLPVVPSLYFVHRTMSPQYTPYLSLGDSGEEWGTTDEALQPVTDFSDIAPVFKQRLIACLSQLIDPTIPFRATPNAKSCASCEFRQLCGH